MVIQQLRDDAASGRLSVQKLIDVIVMQQKRIDELEAAIRSKNPTERLDEPYSQDAEAKRKRGKNRNRPKPLRRGRISTQGKIKLAERTEQVYPRGIL